MRITTEQYRKIKDKRRLSKDDEKRLEKWLDPIESEDKAQEKFAKFLDLLILNGRVIKYTAIPGDTYTPFRSVKSRTKRIWYHKGIPDMYIIYRTQQGEKQAVFVEMKREKGGVVSKEQKEWIEAITWLQCTSAHVCKWFEEARGLILSLIS